MSARTWRRRSPKSALWPASAGSVLPSLRVQLRSGDTTPAQRAAMIRRPPQIVVTTPESLYLLVTSERSRERLRSVHTLIVDEIHALAGQKRGVHLALTIERLAALCERPPQRVGLSATQHPIEYTAQLLVGAGADRSTPEGRPRCTIVDLGRHRALDLRIEVPGSELGPVASNEQWDEILDHIAQKVEHHRTTLVFVNTRRLAERLAHRLAERLGEDRVAAHHGSLSKERRLRVEERLRAGDLRALVATASLELGIDVGPVELVCQIGSPRSLATLVQRVGRSGHATGRTPKGRLYPTTRDELVECAAALRGVRAGRLDRVVPPALSLDVLAQQIVAACAAESWQEDELYALVRRAAPMAALSRADFDATVELVSEGVQTGRGTRGAHVHRDRVNSVLRGRRGARIAALTSGGAIPETADYRVVLDPDDTFIGTVNEDWAIESQSGDIFLLGSTSWRIRRVEQGTVRVTDAGGAAAVGPVLARRGAGPNRRALGRGLGAARRDRGVSCQSESRSGAGLARDGVRARRRRGRADRAIPRRRTRCARRPADTAGRGLRALLRRGGRNAARDPCALRSAREPRPRARTAQALLPQLRLRAPGRSER